MFPAKTNRMRLLFHHVLALGVVLSCMATRVSAQSANEALKTAADGPLKGVLQFSDEELVSVDFLHNSHSSIVDGPLTNALGDRMVKVFSWYDNEWGFSCRLRDVIKLVLR